MKRHISDTCSPTIGRFHGNSALKTAVMSRYPPQDYRGPSRDHSRSPRFSERRASVANTFDSRSDTPRGPRFDGARPPLSTGLSSGSVSRSSYASLRDAPALGSNDGGRPNRDYQYDRRERPLSPRERSPRRNTRDLRDYSSRDLDVNRTRRDSRDGPPSAGPTYSDGQPFRGGSGLRGRGRGDFSFKGGRGGRSNLDDRDLFRRERSPPRWGRDLSRDGRDRLDERRFERREDDRRPSEWADREREFDRNRKPEESVSSASVTYQSLPAPPINPARLAMIEGSGDTSVRRASIHQDAPSTRDAPPTRDESYLNGRAETTANRYASRDSSPPTQAPPVPAFTLSFAPPASTQVPQSQPPPSNQQSKATFGAKPTLASSNAVSQDTKSAEEQKPEPPADAPTAPRAPPPAPKAQLVSPPPAAPRAPRAHESEDSAPPGSRHQDSRSLESLSGNATSGSGLSRPEGFTNPMRPSSIPVSPANAPALPAVVEPVSPVTSQTNKLAELGAPTGPRAARMSPAQASVSPRPPFVSPRSDIGGFPGTSGQPRMQTPPPSAPSGPRNQSYSVSPKVASSNIPTAPKANRGLPLAPRGPERGAMAPARAAERFGLSQGLAPPTAPRGSQWNQWRRQGPPGFFEKTVPAKRDFSGEEKGRPIDQSYQFMPAQHDPNASVKHEDRSARISDTPAIRAERQTGDDMDNEKETSKRQSSLVSGHSAAQSFFGKPNDEPDEDTSMSDTGQEVPSTSEDEESDMETDLTLFNAKFERQKRQLEAQKVDLSTRHYRATTPLESIARLARISGRDLQRVQELREQEMDVDGSPVAHTNSVLPTTHSSDSGEGPDLLTPKGEDDHRITIRSSEDDSDGIQRVRRPTPEPVSLPYLLKEAEVPFNESDVFKDTVKRHEESKSEMLYAMEEAYLAGEDNDLDIEEAFAELYRKWREECEDLDRSKEEQERLERQQSLEPGPELDAPSVAPINPVYEGRRLHKFSSEYEIEQVLKQSEETARIEQERQDREAKKNQADMEKEAWVPDQETEDDLMRGVFIDSNRYRDPESLTLVFSYQPPADTFTETEQQVFIAAFKETPKKWGEIASLLPGRSYEDCIRHYYANKWDNRFRDNRTKKLKAGGRRGRGGARGPRGRVGGLMADLARAEDLLSPENMSERGRPRRAAAPITFAEKEAEAKANLLGPSPAKKAGSGAKGDSNGETGPDKPGKRQRRTGEKPGRKAKSTQPLAALAPQASPGKQFMPGVHSKEELARVQKLEDASLLASLQSVHHGTLNADGHMVYTQEGFMPPLEEPERSKPPAQGTTAKQGASSYWSVPEQNDFVKYIGHFGRDFAAIATHMGTKTQTMIKNHYQRQVDGGNRPELERAANDADDRRARGEEMGPPPTPTPIVKRKYDNPQVPAQRPLAPHSEAMDIDDTGSRPRAKVPKHISPPQYPPDPRFTTSIRDTPVSAPRVAPSPLLTTSTPATSQLQATSHSKPMQHPLGSRITFLPDTRSETRPTAPLTSGFHGTQETQQQNQSSQPGRSVPDAQDPQYLRNLAQERERALRLQEQYTQADRIDQLQRQTSLHRNPSQDSPVNQPLQSPSDRKLFTDDRPPSPPRSMFSTSNLPRGLHGSSNFGNPGPTPFSSLTGRSPFNQSPPKREESRPSSVPTAPPAVPPTSSAPPSEPKRSNVMSLLNSEPEEPKPEKRESLPSAVPRPTSPPQTFPHTTAPTPLSAMPAMRRKPSFGQPSLMQSQFQRGPFGQPGSTPVPQTLKHDQSPGSGSLSQPAKPDWAARVLGQTSQPSPPTPTLERDVRPYYSHRAVLGSITQSRMNPSPPPIGGMDHSRRSSFTAQQGQHSREQSQSGLTSQQQSATHQPAQPLQPNPYATQQPSTFAQHQQGQVQNQSRHSHNSSVGGSFPGLHHRTMSREDHTRQAQVQREREEQERRWRQQREALDAERRREEQFTARRHQEQERERERQQQALHRGPPPQPLQPPPFSGGAFGQSRSLDLRGQSRMETEMAIREEQERQHQQQDAHMRRQQAEQQDAQMKRQQTALRDREQEEFRRRQEESLFQRRTPLGGGYGIPPPGPRR